MSRNETTPAPAAGRTRISIAPTWSSIVPLLLATMRDGTEKGRAMVAEELRAMAKVADLAIAQAELVATATAEDRAAPKMLAVLQRWEKFCAENYGPNAAENVSWIEEQREAIRLATAPDAVK